MSHLNSLEIWWDLLSEMSCIFFKYNICFSYVQCNDGDLSLHWSMGQKKGGNYSQLKKWARMLHDKPVVWLKCAWLWRIKFEVEPGQSELDLKTWAIPLFNYLTFLIISNPYIIESINFSSFIYLHFLSGLKIAAILLSTIKRSLYMVLLD